MSRILLTADPGLPVPPQLYGGIERIVDGLAAELRRRGYQVGLVADRESTCEVDQLFPWPEKKSSLEQANGLRNSVALRRAIRSFRPNIIHSFSRLGYLLSVLPASMPKVMSYQRYTGGRQISIGARLGRRSIVFTGCSEFIAAMGRRWGGEWVVVHNFVDTEYYQFQHSVAGDAPLVYLGRIEKIKGVHSAIDIAIGAGRRLVIAGNRVEDGEGSAYWNQCIAPRVGRNGIEYVGPVNDAQKNELLGKAAAMVVPIEWDEPFGIVFAEALACGTPVISYPRGALPEIVESGTHGFLVRNVDEGIAAVRQIETIRRKTCRERAEKVFSRQVVVDAYERLYLKMIKA